MQGSEKGRESQEGGLWKGQAGQRLVLDLGIRSSLVTSEKTVSLENHYIYNNNENYINIHIPICVCLPLHLNSDLEFIKYKPFLNHSFPTIRYFHSLIYLFHK